jgi:glycosyltransferase involved in cell wall biosynthesis
MQDFRPRSGATGDKHILFVGRLIAVKGLSYLIRAICLVREAEPDVRLTVIGDGPMRQEYESQARKELVTGYEFLGAQPHSVVNACMEASYLFSMPSITMPNGQAEAFGLVFVEAQAMGLPVVSFISGAIPEVVSHGETGLLVNEGDIDGLAAALIQLLRSRTLRDKMGAAARQRAITMFDLEKQNEKLERLYGEVLAAAGLSSR